MEKLKFYQYFLEGLEFAFNNPNNLDFKQAFEDIYKKFEWQHICEDWGMVNAEKDEQGLIKVNGNVDFAYSNLSELPLNFSEVTGNFDIAYSAIRNLKGCPKYVGGNFDIVECKLKDLSHFPEHIGGDLHAYGNSFAITEEEIREFIKVDGVIYL
jgi:hypothetical protein